MARGDTRTLRIRPGPHYHRIVANIPTAASAITPVATHPKHFNTGRSVNSPITSVREARTIIIAITGTATTPFTTALQNNALIGSIGEKFSSAPRMNATVIVP